MPSFGSGRGTVAVLCALAVFLLQSGVGSADKLRCRLERIDLSAFDKTGQIKALGGIVELEGQIKLSQPARDFRLQVNGKTVVRAEKLEPFERTGQELYIALLVEISALYAPAIEKIKDALKEFLESLSVRTKVKLILFGYDIEQQPTFMPAPAVAPLIDDINPDDQGDVQLLNAINAGLAALAKVQPGKDKSGELLPPPRKIIVVLSDGLNQLMDRKSFKRIGDLIKHNNVTLFPVAFSVRDDRGPLLNLGELAKRSAGTFRWATSDDNLKQQFTNLSEELRLGSVISFPAKKFSASELQTASFTLGCGELKSAALQTSFGPPLKQSRLWRWLLSIFGGLVGLWLLAQGALFILKRRMAKTKSLPPPNLARTTQAVTMAQPAPPPAASVVPITPGRRLHTATLIGIGVGQYGGQRIKLEASLLIGKAVAGPSSLLISDDASLAAVHCEIQRDGAGYVLYDKNAASGIFINDRRISGFVRIEHGDIVRLGSNTQFRFRLDD